MYCIYPAHSICITTMKRKSKVKLKSTMRPKRTYRPVTITLDEQTIERLKDIAWRNRTSVSGLIRDLVADKAREG